MMHENDIKKAVYETLMGEQVSSTGRGKIEVNAETSGKRILSHVLPETRLAPSRPSGPDEAYVA